MKALKYLMYMVLGLALILFDVSFLSSLELYGATILTSFLALIIVTVYDSGDDYVFFSLILILLYTILSSLPLIAIILDFLVLPIVLNFIIRKYFNHPNNFTIIFYLFAATFVFEFILLVVSMEWNADGFLAVGYFTILNSFVGWLLNLVYVSLKKKITLDTSVKI